MILPEKRSYIVVTYLLWGYESDLRNDLACINILCYDDNHSCGDRFHKVRYRAINVIRQQLSRAYEKHLLKELEILSNVRSLAERGK
jgi:hypothetical protein